MPLKNFDFSINDVDGNSIKQPDKDGKEKELIARIVVVNSLLNNFTEQDSGEDKAKRYSLAMILNKGGEHDLSPEDIVLIKALVGKGFGPIVVGQIYDYLNK